MILHHFALRGRNKRRNNFLKIADKKSLNDWELNSWKTRNIFLSIG